MRAHSSSPVWYRYPGHSDSMCGRENHKHNLRERVTAVNRDGCHTLFQMMTFVMMPLGKMSSGLA
jgi:hypothetical protein